MNIDPETLHNRADHLEEIAMNLRSLADAPSRTGLSFGDAIERMKRGDAVSRAGWNGKGMFIYLVAPGSYPAQTEVARGFFGYKALVPYRAYVAMKTVDSEVVPWVCSQSDMLADDWSVADTAPAMDATNETSTRAAIDAAMENGYGSFDQRHQGAEPDDCETPYGPFDFDTALRYMRAGRPVKRASWPYNHLLVVGEKGFYWSPAAIAHGRRITQDDILAGDWQRVI